MRGGGGLKKEMPGVSDLGIVAVRAEAGGALSVGRIGKGGIDVSGAARKDFVDAAEVVAGVE